MPISSSPSSPSRSGRRPSAAFALFGVAVVACGNTSDMPAQLKTHAPPNPLACGVVVDAGAPLDGLVVVDGGPASCAADGMVCPLPADVTAPAQCGNARVIAICQQTRWVVSCGDAGAGDAAAD